MQPALNGVVFICFMLISFPLYSQGPLTPPGAPAPNFKTLEQIESRTPIGPDTTPGDATALFIISQPGSYYLTGNMSGEAGKHGIVINAVPVTLDLTGFNLTGVPASLNGIELQIESVKGFTIRNGLIENWGGDGLSGNFQNVINIQNVTSLANAGDGFDVGSLSLIKNCLAHNNGGLGFRLSGSSSAIECVASANILGGFFAEAGCLIINCVAQANSTYGIRLLGGASAHQCSVINTKNADSSGIVMDATSEASDCAVRNGEGNGILAGPNTMISRCTVRSNNLVGIQAADNVLIVENNVIQNDSHGIVAEDSCLVKDNNVTKNDGDGIRVTGTRTRVDSNHVTDHTSAGAAGIRLFTDTATRCMVVRNSCGGNTTEFSLPAGNPPGHITGPLVTSNADPDIANPWGNFDLPETP